MHIVDVTCVPALSGDALHNVAVRANALIESLQMSDPVRCTLYDGEGARLAVFVLGEEDADEKFCDVEQAWLRSVSGVTLLIEDSRGASAEIALIITGESVNSN